MKLAASSKRCDYWGWWFHAPWRVFCGWVLICPDEGQSSRTASVFATVLTAPKHLHADISNRKSSQLPGWLVLKKLVSYGVVWHKTRWGGWWSPLLSCELCDVDLNHVTLISCSALRASLPPVYCTFRELNWIWCIKQTVGLLLNKIIVEFTNSHWKHIKTYVIMLISAPMVCKSGDRSVFNYGTF